MQILHMHLNMARPKPPLPPRDRRTELREAAEVVANDCLAGFARLASRRINGFLEARLASTGLAPAQISLMAHLASAQDDSLGALARRAGLDPSSLTRSLQALARQGLVEIARPDGRRKLAWLTETGVRRLAWALPVWRDAHAELCALIPAALPRQLAEAAAVLEKDA
jgi:DNA-binding MarR family transcriptional regulator